MASAKDPSATLGMTIRGNAHPTRPPPLQEPTSAPWGHLLPEEGGRLPLPMQKAYDMRMPPPLSSFRARSNKASASDSTASRFVISSESEKSFSFAASQGCEDSGERETPYFRQIGITVFHADRST